ncbi:hypothetical protein ACH5RR_008430 [Cinchona calisaya]|uniref:Myb/SANT-like domain-containing protein n=1 Tax=Cinchona calisaya TaxID=153742 RepID=A0ABD3AC10_9GENT
MVERRYHTITKTVKQSGCEWDDDEKLSNVGATDRDNKEAVGDYEDVVNNLEAKEKMLKLLMLIVKLMMKQALALQECKSNK